MPAMIKRPFWTERLAAAWKQASIVWLTGPRRAGKTVLAQSIPDAEFLNCDLPSVAERLRDPESFFRSVRKKLVVFDEVHQLPDPSRLLKIGADDFPKVENPGDGVVHARGHTKIPRQPDGAQAGGGDCARVA